MAEKYSCPVCGQKTLDSVGEYDICMNCQWEDDPLQKSNPTYPGGANHMSLEEAKRAYKNNLPVK